MYKNSLIYLFWIKILDNFYIHQNLKRFSKYNFIINILIEYSNFFKTQITFLKLNISE